MGACRTTCCTSQALSGPCSSPSETAEGQAAEAQQFAERLLKEAASGGAVAQLAELAAADRDGRHVVWVAEHRLPRPCCSPQASQGPTR